MRNTTIPGAHFGFAGFMQIEKHREDADGAEIPGSRKVVAPWFPNLITNNGLDLLGGNYAVRYMSVGSGNTVPQETDTSLSSHIATVGHSGNSGVPGPVGADYVSGIWTYVFPQGSAEGIIAELGAGASNGNTNLFSRALVRDPGGNPTTIVIEDIDILTVTYQVRCYLSQSDVVATVDGYNTITRTANGFYASRLAGSSTGWLAGAGPFFGSNPFSVTNGDIGPWTGSPSGSLSYGTGSMVSYVPGTHYVDLVGNLSITQGNVSGGIRSAVFGAPNAPQQHQIQFDPPIPKDNTKTLTVRSRMSWGRHTP